MNNRADISERPFNLSLATSVSSFHLRGGNLKVKKCIRCKRVLPLDEFGPDKIKSDGKRSMCRRCDREKARKYYSANKEKKRVYNAEYHKEHREQLIANAKSRMESEPEKAVAKRIFRDAIKRKKIVRPKQCSRCGKSCKPDGHHTDYSKPLEVVWLCRSCHHYEHRGVEALTAQEGKG